MFDPTRALWYAFTHFYHSDKSNAAFHCADVRFSPITFRLAEALDIETDHIGTLSEEVMEVLRHKGQYEEDQGRQ